jgi:hypothetical protein
MKAARAILTALIITGGMSSAGVSADTNQIQPSAGFSYATSRWTTVDISLAGVADSPALLSIYSQGTNGLRLLQNAFTDPTGRYLGDLKLPAHLDQVVVVVRTAERQDRLELPVDNLVIAYAE